MSSTEEISLWAGALAVIALFNWLTGDRSIRGRELLVRQGAVWVAFRWFGLGLWTATLIASGQNDFWLECAGLAGASVLLLGTARQTKKLNLKSDEREHKGEQGIAPNRSTASLLNSESSVRGSED